MNALGAKTILAKTNSQVVVEQVKKRVYGMRTRASQILATVRALEQRF